MPRCGRLLGAVLRGRKAGVSMRAFVVRSLPVASLAVGLVAGSSSAAFAQAASRITPPSFRPDTAAPSGGSLVFSGQPGLGAPAGAERLSVRLSGVSVEGGRAEMADAQRALQARLVGRRIAASEIFAAARELEAAYGRAGFVLTRIVLPAQTLKDGGRLRLVVVQGYIERIEVRGAGDGARERIEAVLAPLIGQRGVTQGELERRLLLAGDTPGVGLRSALTPGSAAGGTILVVDSKYRPISGFVGVDNTLARSLGRWSTGVGLDTNSVLGTGEVFYIRAFGHPSGDGPDGFGSFASDKPRLRTLAAGGVFPLGIDGMTFNLEGTESRTTPKPFLGVQTASDYERVSFRLRYPWIRSRAFNFNTEAAFDVSSEKLNFVVPGTTLPLSLDRLRIFRLAADGDYKLPTGGLFAGRAILSFGIDGLGARSAADATPTLPLSRFGADADFQKFEGLVSVTQPVAEHVVLGFYARGQTSFGHVMPRSEQIGTASFLELSGFDAGTLGGDSGYIVRGEVSSPWTVSVDAKPVNVAPYVFAATSGLYLEQPTFLERAHGQFTSVGVGVRLAAPLDEAFTQASLTLEYARRIRDDGFGDANRFNLVGSIRF